jgi:hypothetical protein
VPAAPTATTKVVALGVALADEQHASGELVVVLVGTAGAVVLDQEQPWVVSGRVGDFEGGVGDDHAGAGVPQAFDRPVAFEA